MMMPVEKVTKGLVLMIYAIMTIGYRHGLTMIIAIYVIMMVVVMAHVAHYALFLRLSLWGQIYVFLNDSGRLTDSQV